MSVLDFLNLTASYCLGGKCPQEWLLREENFGQFLVYEP